MVVVGESKPRRLVEEVTMSRFLNRYALGGASVILVALSLTAPLGAAPVATKKPIQIDTRTRGMAEGPGISSSTWGRAATSDRWFSRILPLERFQNGARRYALLHRDGDGYVERKERDARDPGRRPGIPDGNRRHPGVGGQVVDREWDRRLLRNDRRRPVLRHRQSNSNDHQRSTGFVRP